MRTRVILLAASVFTLLSVSLAQTVTVTFWHGYNPTETALLDAEIIPAFEAAHPGIDIEAQGVPYDSFRQKLLTSLAGGTPPNVARLDIIWVPEFAELGALVALDEVMPDFSTFRDAMFPGPLSTNFWQGHYYGLPLDTNTRVLMWNQEMFQAAGLAGPPATIAELEAVCAALKSLGENVYCFADGGTYGWAVLPWIWSFGGSLTDPELTRATGYLNSPQTVAAYTFLKSLLDRGYLAPGILGGGIDTSGGFASDQIATLLEGPWIVAIFAGQYPDTPVNLAPVPAGAGGSISVVGGEDIAVFADAPNQDAALEFVRFMLSTETQLRLASVGQIPVRADVTDAAVAAQPYFQTFFNQLQTARARLPHPNWPRIEDILTGAGQAILRGEQTPQEALDAAAASIDALLATQ